MDTTHRRVQVASGLHRPYLDDMQQADRPTVRLRVERWQSECQARGLTSDRSRAVAIGYDRRELIRLQNRERTPGAVFVAAVLHAFRSCRFEDLFEVVA